MVVGNEKQFLIKYSGGAAWSCSLIVFWSPGQVEGVPGHGKGWDEDDL